MSGPLWIVFVRQGGIDSDNQEEGVTSEMGFQDSKKKEKNNIF